MGARCKQVKHHIVPSVNLTFHKLSFKALDLYVGE